MVVQRVLALSRDERNGFGASDMWKVANDTILTPTLTEARAIAGHRRFWIGLLGAVFIVGLAGPFGTYGQMSVPLRLGYWGVVIITTFWLGFLVSFATATLLDGVSAWPTLNTGLGAVLASLPVTAWLAGWHGLVIDTSFWPEFMRLWPYVAAISVVIALVSDKLSAPDPLEGAVTASAPEPAWLDRLPARLGRDLLLLQAQDHYLRAETALGEGLIRETLDDAARDLGEFGLRIHRSWWVARAAVVAYRHNGGAPVVVLQDGRQLSVGRTYRRDVRQRLSR